MNYCLFTIKSGAGGVEAKDFTNMLFKMYCKFFNKNIRDNEALTCLKLIK